MRKQPHNRNTQIICGMKVRVTRRYIPAVVRREMMGLPPKEPMVVVPLVFSPEIDKLIRRTAAKKHISVDRFIVQLMLAYIEEKRNG